MIGKSLRVGIISQWYAPEPVLIPKDVTDALVEDNNSVKVLTGFPNYPGGVIYAGFEGSTPEETWHDAVNIRRVRSFVSHDQSAVRRMRTFLSFAWSSLKNARFLSDREVIYVYGTPMTVAAAALYLRLKNRIPFVIHIQDLWPESVLDSGMLKTGLVKKLIQGAMSAFLRPVYHYAQHIIVISPGMKDALIARKVEASKISVLYNWHAGEKHVTMNPSARPSGSGPVRCTYAGNIGVMQDVETIIRAAVEVQHELDLEIRIYGSGVAESRVRSLADELGARNVKFMGRVAMSEMQGVYEQSDFQLVTLKDRDVFRFTVPSKFQASLANATPVITTVAGDLAAICIDERVGLVAEPESSSSLAEAFRQAVSLGPEGRAEMATRSAELYWARMSADNATRTINYRLRNAAASTAGIRSIEPKGKERAEQ